MTQMPQPLRRSAAEQVILDAALCDIFERRICFNEVLGFRVEKTNPALAVISFAMRPDLVGHYQHGRLHGGVISTALDTVGGFAVTVAIGEKYANEDAAQVAHRFGRIGTIDLRVDYLRPGIGKKFTASGRITRLGGRIASVQMTLENETGLLLATGSASYVVS